MSVNSETKRRSVLGMTIMALVIAPVPDGTVAAVDREHIIGIYAGIPPSSPAIQTDHINIISSGKIEPNHAADISDNLLIADTLEVQQDLYAGGASNYLKVIDGAAVFVGTAGLPYGNCYGDHVNWTQASAVQNTWYAIADSTMTDNGNLNGITHDGNGLLTVTNAGRYLVTCALTWLVNKQNNHVDVGIQVDGSGAAVESHAHTESKFANQEHVVVVTCILDLAASATIQVAIRTLDAIANTDFTVDDVNLTCLHIGGT